MRPQSIAIRSSPESISIMLRPISPSPPRGISRTAGSRAGIAGSKSVLSLRNPHPSTGFPMPEVSGRRAGVRGEGGALARPETRYAPHLYAQSQSHGKRLRLRRPAEATVSGRAPRPRPAHRQFGPTLRTRPPGRFGRERERRESLGGGLEGGFGLEAVNERPGVLQECGALVRRNGLAGNELLAERIHERAVARDAVIEVGAGGQPGGADVADHLTLAHAGTRRQTRAQPREVVVHRLVARAVAEAHRDAIATRPAGRDHSSVGHGTN